MKELNLMNRPLLACLAVAVLLAAGSAPARAQSAAKVFTFGAMFPLSGPAAEIGSEFQRGLDLAIADINSKGGVDGYQLKATVVDHKGTALGGAQAMNQLVNLEKVPFVLTTFTGVALTAQPIAAQNSVLLMNVGGTSNNLLDKPWLYNDQVMGDALNEPLAKYAYEKGARNAALLTSEDAYGKDDGIAFTASFTKAGGKIAASETFPLSSTDFTPQLTKIAAANPDVLYVVAVGDTQGLLIKQARALGLKAQILGPLPTVGAITVGGKAAEGFIGSGIAVDPTTKDPAAKAFLEEFRAKFNSVPEWDSGTPYEAVHYLATLIHDVVKAGGDPRSGAALLKALTARPTFQNYLSGGMVRLLNDHGSVRALQLQQVKDGKYVTIRVVAPGK
jgi:ABC-type branched-subunit amino acid transport system substrate-binding protein